MTAETIAAALWYADRGYAVLPLHSASAGACSCANATCENVGKHPRTRHGLSDATSDVVKVREYWRQWPDANIGIATGPSKLVVIDVDPKNGGEESFAALRAELGFETFDTVTALTGGGGEHYYFHDESGQFRNSASLLAPGIDVRAVGGYVVAPPSVHGSGRKYTWEESSRINERDIVPLPESLANRLRKPKPAIPIGGATVMELKIKQGGRDNALAAIAGTLRRQGFQADEIFALLTTTNEKRCEPPLPENDLRRIADSIARYEPSAPMPELANAASAEPLGFVDAADLLAQTFEPPSFLVRPLLPSAAIVLLTADTGAGKTAFALHCALAIANGVACAERFDVDKSRRVLYLNGEMSANTLQRYLHEAAAGLKLAVPRGLMFFEGVDGFASFHFANTGRQLEALVDKVRPDLVVFDTQRALLVGDENETMEVRRVFGWIRSELVNRRGCVVLVTHHLRKIGAVSNNERERVAGSRDILASVDVHLSALSSQGRPMHALQLEKTRFPVDGFVAGTKWPLEARLVAGAPNRSIFVAAEPEQLDTGESAEDAADEIRARLSAEGPLTIADIGAKGGRMKRAWDKLQKSGEIFPTGAKSGRASLYGLRGTHADEHGRASDRTRDNKSRKATSDGEMSAVTHRPHSDRAGRPRLSDSEASEASDRAEPRPYASAVTHGVYSDRDRTREIGSSEGACAFPIGAPGDACSREGCGWPYEEHFPRRAAS